ncbi:MAG: AsmA family protein [Candidatus Korobacteraceae bacterium]
MRGRTSRRMLWAVLLVLVLALLLPPFVNVNRYRNRVTGALSRALGRDVSVSNIELKLLPRPGLVLSNFIVVENPSYGAEPMLRADTVTAYLRLTSLWRGRLEIGTLDLDNPSLNLVRRPDGHWNIEELVERTSQTSPAPTSRIRPEARPRFPYVKASSGRINFKLGPVKKAFAFTDADFALWLETENQWGVRLDARPTRTDVNITDTGTLKLDGRFQRAANLRDTPLYIKVSFSDGPLGQMTKLLYGRDRGWRGLLRTSAILTGSPAALGITVDAQVDDFRRYDIALGEALRLRAHCTGTYSSNGDLLYDTRCEAPVGSGVLQVRGDAQGWPGGYEWSISGEHIPAERVVAFARHAKKDLPSDLTATGEVAAVFTFRKPPGGTPLWEGGGSTSAFALRSDVLKQDLELGEVQFLVPSSKTVVAPKGRKGPRRVPSTVVNTGFHLVLKPFAMPLGAASPAIAGGSADTERYSLHLTGNAELARLMKVAQALGIGTPGVGLAGNAHLDIEAAGAWMGFAPPSLAGKVLLQTATAELQGVSEPLLIDSAAVTLENQLASITSFRASFSKGTALNGSANFPIHCTSPENCVLRFDVHADDVSLTRANQLLNPSFSRQPWYHLLAIGRWHEDALLKLRASGHFSTQRLELGPLTASNVNGTVELSGGKLRIGELQADFLGGHQDGSWIADFSNSPPRFMGNGVVNKLSMTQLGGLMHDNWATGSIDAEYSLTLAGLNPSSLRDSASGTADFTWSGGSLRHITLDGRGAPLTFSSFAGKLGLQNAAFTVTDGKLRSSGATFTVKGTASYNRSLEVKLDHSGGGRSYVISGTLDQPRVETVTAPTAEAALR